MDNLNEAITHLAFCRGDEKAIAELIGTFEKEIAASDLGQRLQVAREVLIGIKATVTQASQEVREAALTTYEETGEKSPHPAIKVKIYTVLEYSDSEALDYAHRLLPEALKLDKRTFEKVARAIEPEFVTVTQEARATIARNLSQYLPDIVKEQDAIHSI